MASWYRLRTHDSRGSSLRQSFSTWQEDTWLNGNEPTTASMAPDGRNPPTLSLGYIQNGIYPDVSQKAKFADALSASTRSFRGATKQNWHPHIRLNCAHRLRAEQSISIPYYLGGQYYQQYKPPGYGSKSILIKTTNLSKDYLHRWTSGSHLH